MNRKWIRNTVPALLACAAVSVQAQVDEDFMRYVEDTYKSADNNVSVRDAPAATKDAKELVELFREVETHYAAKGNEEDGVKLSRQSVALSAALVERLAAQDFDAASQATREIGRTCKSCHNIYKD